MRMIIGWKIAAILNNIKKALANFFLKVEFCVDYLAYSISVHYFISRRGTSRAAFICGQGIFV